MLATTNSFAQSSGRVSSKDKIAILPMTFIANGNDLHDEQMGYNLQNIASEILSGSSGSLRLMDASNVNATLRRNGITLYNFRDYSPAEIAEVLNVQYVVMGTVRIERGRQVTVAHREVRSNHNHDRHRHDRWHNRNRRQYTERVVTNQLYETEVSLSIYSESGDKIYHRSRQSLLSEPDAYRNTLRYLLKRTPVYKR